MHYFYDRLKTRGIKYKLQLTTWGQKIQPKEQMMKNIVCLIKIIIHNIWAIKRTTYT